MARPLVTIKLEVLDDIDKTLKIEGDKNTPSIPSSTSNTSQVLSVNAINNNTSDNSSKIPTADAFSGATCYLSIKEEPIEDCTETNLPVPSGKKSSSQVPELIEVTTEKIITIKAEPRVIADEEGSNKEDNSIENGNDIEDAESDDDLGEGDDEEDELEFEDDLNDLDFEIDSSESADTPDSEVGRSHEGEESASGSPDSIEVDLTLVKEEAVDELSKDESYGAPLPDDADDLLESSRPKKSTGSFDFNGTKIETYGNYSKCPKCQKSIKSTFIIRHIKLHDVATEKFNCPEKNCNLQVNRINNLFRHLKVVHKSKKPYMCKHPDCKSRFAKAPQLRAHFTQHRAERRKRLEMAGQLADTNKIFTCEFPGCGKEYKKRHHLKEHERKHTGDMKYSCEVCGKRFYMQAHMKRHLYSHTGIKPHVCRWKCGAIFASYGGRMKHERINHYDENPLQSECDICGRPFKNQQQLSKHRMTHLNPDERKDYRCGFCHIMFDTVKLRERHEERHRDGEDFSCETCGKVFKNEKNLSHHVKTHHVKKDDEGSSKKAKKDPPAKHHCHLCGPPKLFCLTSLRRHLARIHSTNYKCSREECGKCFKEKVQLDAHEEIHRLRECHLCGKKFQRKQNADIHLLGVHNMTKDDLDKLGRWKPKKDLDKCPDYMTRKTNTASFKKFRQKQQQKTGAKAPDASDVDYIVVAGVRPDENYDDIAESDDDDEDDDVAEHDGRDNDIEIL